MKTLISALALTLALVSYSHAAEPDGDDAATPPARTTAAPAKAVPAAPAAMSQRDRMRKCNADAHGLKGGERRDYMSHCLSKKKAG